MSFLALITLLPLALAGATTYTISPSSHPDYCLAPASSAEGADLVLKPCDTSSDIVFTFEGDELRNTETNMCIDVRDGSDQSGTLLQMWSCYGYNTNQRFDVNGQEIKWVGHDRCTDLKDGLGQEGNQVQIWSCYGHNTNQRWILTEAEEIEADVIDEDCETGSPTSPATPAPTEDADDAEDCDEFGNPIVDDEDDEEDLPYCEDDQQAESEHAYVRRGRGQHWQRSLDSELVKLDRSYVPHAPSSERRSRRRAVTHVSPTSTGL